MPAAASWDAAVSSSTVATRTVSAAGVPGAAPEAAAAVTFTSRAPAASSASRTAAVVDSPTPSAAITSTVDGTGTSGPSQRMSCGVGVTTGSGSLRAARTGSPAMGADVVVSSSSAPAPSPSSPSSLEHDTAAVTTTIVSTHAVMMDLARAIGRLLHVLYAGTAAGATDPAHKTRLGDLGRGPARPGGVG